MLLACQKFGAVTVYGRPLGYGEINRMQVAENIINAYRSRAASGNWATWIKSNPELHDMLMAEQRIYNGG